jgi:nucleotide-binding universal stress UspA family protein
MAPRIDEQWPHRVLLPQDGSELGGSAVDAMKAIDPACHAQVLLTTVFQTNIPPMAPWGFQLEPFLEIVDQNHERLRNHLSRTSERLGAWGFKVYTRILTGGKTAREILKLGTLKRCDLIVMATHGAGGLDRVMFGSVADQVIRHSKIPVLVVRPDVDLPAAIPTRPDWALAEAGA